MNLSLETDCHPRPMVSKQLSYFRRLMWKQPSRKHWNATLNKSTRGIYMFTEIKTIKNPPVILSVSHTVYALVSPGGSRWYLMQILSVSHNCVPVQLYCMCGSAKEMKEITHWGEVRLIRRLWLDKQWLGCFFWFKLYVKSRCSLPSTESCNFC